MANKSLFQSLRGVLAPKANAVNEAGGLAYQRSEKQALAQYAATGCLGDTFYASADEQLETVISCAKRSSRSSSLARRSTLVSAAT